MLYKYITNISLVNINKTLHDYLKMQKVHNFFKLDGRTGWENTIFVVLFVYAFCNDLQACLRNIAWKQ